MQTIPRSPRQAIKSKCVDCIYDPAAAGSKLVQTTLCTCTDCPLWPFRPTTKAVIPDSVLKYYRIKPGDPCLSGANAPEIAPVDAFSKRSTLSGVIA